MFKWSEKRLAREIGNINKKLAKDPNNPRLLKKAMEIDLRKKNHFANKQIDTQRHNIQIAKQNEELKKYREYRNNHGRNMMMMTAMNIHLDQQRQQTQLMRDNQANQANQANNNANQNNDSNYDSYDNYSSSAYSCD